MMESQAIICKLANMTEDEMERFITGPVNEDDTLYRGGERGEYDFSPTKGETNDERVERINNKTDELADALKERGFEVTTSKSRTSFGASNYINVFAPNFRPLVKIRLSDIVC
jgi:hypothetical protein